MNECTNGELRDLLPELVNGQLDAESQRSVETHVASCTECAEELALIRLLRPTLMGGPAVDTQRIAAAVRAQTAGAASRAPAPEGTATRWRVAIAAAALIAVSALGYVMGTHRTSGAEHVVLAPTTQGGTRQIAHRALPAPETTHAPVVAAPRSVTVPAPPQRVTVVPPNVTAPTAPPATFASTGVLDNLSDLSDDDVRTLAASLDKLSSVPDADPSPGIDPLGASLEDLSAGGR